MNNTFMLLVAAVLGSAMVSGCTLPAQRVELLDRIGRVETRDMGAATVHRYQGTDDAHVNSILIETDNALVLIDAQHFLSRSMELQRYIDSLDKPLDRIIITHSDPENYMGLPALDADAPVHAAPETLENMQANAESLLTRRKQQGRPWSRQYPDEIRYPTETLEASFVVDGIEYRTENLADSEAPDQIIIAMPALQALHTADILQLDTHIVIVDPDAYLAAIDRIDALIDEGNYRYLLTGRDEILDAAAIESVRVYVEEARDILAEDPSPEKYRARIEAAFPSYGEMGEVLDAMILAGAFD